MRSPRLCLGLLVVALSALTGLGLGPAAAGTDPAPRRGPLGSVGLRQAADSVADSGLVTTIRALTPSVLTRGQAVTIDGVVSNEGNRRWRDVRAYLAISRNPVSTEAELAAIATAPDTPISSPVIMPGRVVRLATIAPGEVKDFRVSVPFRFLPISESTGVYRVGVTVFATNRTVRDNQSDSRAGTLIDFATREADVPPTGVVLLVPITDGVHRNQVGSFADDSLGALMEPGERLHNLLNLIGVAPTGSMDIVVDPAVLEAARNMADGYTVRTNQQIESNTPGTPGHHTVAARDWLARLQRAAQQQEVVFLPYGVPDITALAQARLGRVFQAAITSTKQISDRLLLPGRLVSYPPDGQTTRRALAGADLAVVSQDSLPSLVDPAPSAVTVNTRRGLVKTLVARTGVGGSELSATVSSVELRQQLLASVLATGLLVGDEVTRTLVVATPLSWDPGPVAGSADLFDLYDGQLARPVTVTSALSGTPLSYTGRVRVDGRVDSESLSKGLLDVTARLLRAAKTAAELRTEPADAVALYNETLALAGSSHWRDLPALGEALVAAQARAALADISAVTVTGPSFVALSSDSGGFPLTITNGTTAPVTVRVTVIPEDPGLKISPIDDVELEPGQKRDIEVTSHSTGSGLTDVTVRLTTTSGRPLRATWDMSIRATQIGLVIWIVMGVGAVILVGASGYRIFRRVQASRRDRAAEAAS